MRIYDKSSREAGLMHKVSVVTISKQTSRRLTLYSLEDRLYQTAEAAQHFKVLFPPLSVFVEK